MDIVHAPFGGAAERLRAEAWFDEVFDDTKDAMLRYIFIHIDDPNDVDDVFQETYAQLFQRVERKGWRDIQEPAAFLTTIAKREISRLRRGRKRRETASSEDAAFLAACPESAFEDAIADRSKLEEVRTVVREMPPLTYKVFALYYFFDMPVAEVAARLRMTENAVKSRLNRARNRVRAVIQED